MDDFFAKRLPQLIDPQNPKDPQLVEAISTMRKTIYGLLGDDVLRDMYIDLGRYQQVKKMLQASLTKSDHGTYDLAYFRLVTTASYLNSLEALNQATRNTYYPQGSGRLG